jgi:hypothetical protein
MKTNRALSHALDCLAHPLSLAAMLILLVNATLLQRYAPSWLSGKLGDLAWLCFVPALTAIGLSLIIPPGARLSQRTIGWVALLLTGLAFSLVKTVPSLNALVAYYGGLLIGSPFKLALDPTDLLALPGLAVAYWIWQRPPWRRIYPAVRYAFLGLAVLAVLADSPAPIDFGITCFVQKDNGILAVHSTSYKGSKTYSYYSSTDGGLTWNPYKETSEDETADQCYKDRANSVSLSDPADPNRQFMVVSGQAAYISDDGGATFKRELVLDKDVSVYDIFYDKVNKNILVAAGQQGVLLHTPDGKWQWAQGIGK